MLKTSRLLNCDAVSKNRELECVIGRFELRGVKPVSRGCKRSVNGALRGELVDTEDMQRGY
jgi:hypothetical protein